MRVLMVSKDPKTLVPGTPAFSRMEEYRARVESLEIVVVRPRTYASLFVYNTDSHPDLVTAQDPFEAGFFAWMIAKRFRARLQLQVHTDFLSPEFFRESIKNKIRRMMARFLLPRADCVRVVSSRIKQSLQESSICLKSDPVVLPLFPELRTVSSASGTDLHKKYPEFEVIVLMASRIVREKNIDLAIEALAEVVKNHPKTGLVIVGEGPLKSALVQKVSALGLADSVRFEGWADDLTPLYETADIFLLTSNYEGYGLTLFEAARAGLPIVTTDVGLVGDSIHKGNALVSPVGDRETIVLHLNSFIDDPDLRKRYGASAKEVSHSLGSRDEYISKHMELWKECGIAHQSCL